MTRPLGPDVSEPRCRWPRRRTSQSRDHGAPNAPCEQSPYRMRSGMPRLRMNSRTTAPASRVAPPHDPVPKTPAPPCGSRARFKSMTAAATELDRSRRGTRNCVCFPLMIESTSHERCPRATHSGLVPSPRAVGGPQDGRIRRNGTGSGFTGGPRRRFRGRARRLGCSGGPWRSSCVRSGS
jgi:hypothetical protein